MRSWVQVMEANSFKHLVDLKATFRSADYVKPFTVFNVSGNKYGLVALLDFALQTVSIEHVLTHEEYDELGWREK